jgi:hypothetical protein
VPGRRVRILADDQHLDVGERLLERPEHEVAGGEVPPAARDLGTQEVAHPRDLVRYWFQGFGPARFDDVGQRLRHGPNSNLGLSPGISPGWPFK